MLPRVCFGGPGEPSAFTAFATPRLGFSILPADVLQDHAKIPAYTVWSVFALKPLVLLRIFQPSLRVMILVYPHAS